MSIVRCLLSRPLTTVRTQRIVLNNHAHHPRRQISFTPQRRQSSPSPEELMATLRHTKFFKEIQSNPELREALMDAARVLQEEGACFYQVALVAALPWQQQPVHVLILSWCLQRVRRQQAFDDDVYYELKGAREDVESHGSVPGSEH